MCQILKCSYYKNCCIDHNQILQSDRDPQVLTVGSPNMPQTNPRWRTSAILKKNKKLQYLRNRLTDFDKIWQRRWCVSTFWTPIAIKFRDFKYPRWRRRPSWKFEKSQYLRNKATDFDKILIKWCGWAFQKPIVNKNSRFRKSKMATASILKNRKILMSSQPIDRFWQN